MVITEQVVKLFMLTYDYTSYGSPWDPCTYKETSFKIENFTFLNHRLERMRSNIRILYF